MTAMPVHRAILSERARWQALLYVAHGLGGGGAS